MALKENSPFLRKALRSSRFVAFLIFALFVVHMWSTLQQPALLNERYAPLLEDSEYVTSMQWRDPAYSWSGIQDALVYLSAGTNVLKVINLEGEVQFEKRLPYSASQAANIHDLTWYTDNKIGFVIDNKAVVFDLLTDEITTLFSAESIYNICWSNHGNDVFALVYSEHTRTSALKHFQLAQMQASEFHTEFEGAPKISCSRTELKVLVGTPYNIILSGTDLKHHEVASAVSLWGPTIDEVPNSYFSGDIAGRRGRFTCIALENYDQKTSYTLDRFERDYIKSMSFSKPSSTLLLEVVPAKHQQGSKLYVRHIEFISATAPSPDELVATNCEG